MQQEFSCPKCNSPVAYRIQYCLKCGTPLSWPDIQPAGYQQYQQQQNYDSGQTSTQELRRCIDCKKKSVWFNSYEGLYECLNPKCKRKFTASEITNKRAPISQKFRTKNKKTKQYR
jgi:hypothetical protein